MRNFITISILLIAAGCANTPAPNYTPITKAISFPKVGEEARVSLGEDMLRQGFYTERDGIEFVNENRIGQYRISPGFYPQISEDKKNTFHSYQMSPSFDGLGHIPQATDILGLPMPYPQSIRASKTKQESCIIIGGLQGPACDTEHGYTRVRRPVISERDLQQTLIYSGRIGDRIRLGYRETSGNMARAAYSNEAEYDLSTSNEIAYRGARLRIIEADNEKIRYVVISNFNTK